MLMLIVMVIVMTMMAMIRAMMVWRGFDNERIALRLSTEVLAAKPKERGGKKHLVLAKKKKKTKMTFSYSLHEEKMKTICLFGML